MIPLGVLILWMTVTHTLDPLGPFGAHPVRVEPGAFPLKFLWLVTAGSFVYTMWWSFALKRVAIDGDTIYISDYSREVALPLSAITEITENRWLKLHPVRIAFDRDTPWGRSIKFMPKLRFAMLNWLSHPVVAELREVAFAARAGRRADLGIDRHGTVDSPRRATFS